MPCVHLFTLGFCSGCRDWPLRVLEDDRDAVLVGEPLRHVVHLNDSIATATACGDLDEVRFVYCYPVPREVVPQVRRGRDQQLRAEYPVVELVLCCAVFPPVAQLAGKPDDAGCAKRADVYGPGWNTGS